MTTTTATVPVAERKPTASILKNVTSNWAGIIVSILISFVLAPVTVNSLGNAYYGIWTLLMQFTGYLWLFDFGVRESVIKYVAQYHASGQEKELDATVHTAVSLYSVVALAAFTASLGLVFALPYVFNIPPEAVTTARVTAVLTGATIAQYFVCNVYVGVLMGLQKFYLMARIGMVFGIIRAVLIYGLLTAGYGIITLALVQFGTALVSNVIVYRLCIAELPYLSLRFIRPRREQTMKLLNYGKFVFISNVGDKLIFATDSIIIGIFLPIAALTYYAIGGTLIEHLRAFVTSMASIFNPLSSSLEARKEERTLAAVYLSGTKAAILIGLPVCIGFILLGSRFITLWMGPEYGPTAGLILAVLAAGHLVGLPYYTISGVLYGLGQHRVLAYTRIFEAVANLALSILLVKRFGLVGVALGTVIPHALVVVGFLPSIVPRMLPVRVTEYYVSTYARPFLASIPFWALCWAIDVVLEPSTLAGFLASVALALPAYAVPCWFLALSRGERGQLTHALRRRFQAA